MGRDAASRTIDKAEARERVKARAAVRKWLPLRRAAVAYHGAVELPETAHAIEVVMGLLDAEDVS